MPVSPDLRRRLRLGAARARATRPGGGLRSPCLFLHLPKCGGTSLAAGLAGCVPLTARVGTIDALATRRAAAMLHAGRDDLLACHEDLAHGHRTFALREGLALTQMALGARLVWGHLLLTHRLAYMAAGRYALVTMMRAPVPRALSNYRMAVRAGVIPDDVDAWLDGPVGQSMAQAFLRYLSGRNVVPPADQVQALATARANLARFDLVGFLDAPESFRDAFAARFGPRPALPRYNVAPPADLPLSPAQRRRLEVLAAPDLALYDDARRRFAPAAEAPAPSGPRRSAAAPAGTG